MKPAMTLIVLGGALMLAEVIGGCVTHELDKGRVAEFYSRNGNCVALPNALAPESVRPAEVLGFIAGAVMVTVGIKQSRATAVPPAE